MKYRKLRETKEKRKSKLDLNSRLSALGPEATLVYQILNNEPMTANNLVACLMSEPYNVRYLRILNGLNLLLLKGLIKIFAFEPDRPDRTAKFKVEIRLTTDLGV